MFSIITMASSTTKPVEIVSAISVRLLRLYPRRYIAANVPTKDSGTATLGMIVADGLRRNRKITITTKAMVSDHHRAIIGCGKQLVVGPDLVRLLRTIEAALGGIEAGRHHLGADHLQTEPVGRQRRRVRPDADRRLLAAADADETDTGELG